MKVQAEIEAKVRSALEPAHLTVVNESHQHNVPENSETHFKLTCVSSEFEGMMKVKRHQQIYGILANELNSGVHALALHLYTPTEWDKVTATPASPQCLGGSK